MKGENRLRPNNLPPFPFIHLLHTLFTDYHKRYQYNEEDGLELLGTEERRAAVRTCASVCICPSETESGVILGTKLTQFVANNDVLIMRVYPLCIQQFVPQHRFLGGLYWE